MQWLRQQWGKKSGGMRAPNDLAQSLKIQTKDDLSKKRHGVATGVARPYGVVMATPAPPKSVQDTK